MSKKSKLYLGLDVGSVSLNTVLINHEGSILDEHYTRTRGQPLKTVMEVLSEIFSRISPETIYDIAVTGSAGKLVSELLGGRFVNEIIAQGKAIEHLYPQVRTIIEMGGEDSKLILLDSGKNIKDLKITDFSMNTICAAGTGSFLDQQAARLQLSIDDFSRLPLKSTNPPRIAGRCSVFAKSDMIHLQQVATADFDIVAGLCYAMARNFKGTIGRGKSFIQPVSFQGGVAANLGMRKAFLDILELDENELIIPKHFASMGAIGASLANRDNKSVKFQGLERLENFFQNLKEKKTGLAPLNISSGKNDSPEKNQDLFPSKQKTGKIDAYLGIDVGSISTNIAVIDEDGNLLAKRYLMTAGRPIEAIKQGLAGIEDKAGTLVNIVGVGTTGSGRYLTGDFVGADIIKNEITAQATAAARIDPKVDTIFEIGGQDSKYISLYQGTIVDFEMNKVCAAGTGSFLEEQAEKLEISIKKEFGNLALMAKNPTPLGERCTVFMESDLIHHQQRGAKKDDLAAGLSYSIVQNYLNRVVENRKIGEHIFFQGGTAANLGVVAAFEKILGKKITIPKHHEVTGALGMAILAKEERNWKISNFKGFGLSQREYQLSSFECQDCPNQCEIKKVKVAGEKPLFYGSRCDKFEVNKKVAGENLPDLFSEREKLLLKNYSMSPPPSPGSVRIGIPLTLFFHELLPLWKTFFSHLGFEVVLSDLTHNKITRQGAERVMSETCFPIKVAHGHVLDLIEKKVDKIFLPSIINLKRMQPEVKLSHTCPYIQSIPYLVRSAINMESLGIDLLQPVIFLGEGNKILEKSLVKMGKKLKKGSSEVINAFKKAKNAQIDFYKTIKLRGEEVLQSLGKSGRAMVIVSRPYNGCDPGVNLNLPQKIRNMKIIAMPMDFLPLEEENLVDEWKDMYWKYGQRILSAAHIIKNDSRLHAIYLTNFSCGPDSFISHFFREKLKGKPYLTIEIDEHSADVGIITRLEAFVDSLKISHRSPSLPMEKFRKKSSRLQSKKVYVPYMCDHSLAVSAALEACGISSQVLPESDEKTLFWGRKFTSGRECYPCILTTGDMIRMVKSSDFDARNSSFFMPAGSGPCRFGQYNNFHRLVLDELGLKDVPIYAPNQDESFYQELGIAGSNFARLAWQGIVAIDILEKKGREIRPYELKPGETDALYQNLLTKILGRIKKGEGLKDLLKEAWLQFGRINKKDENNRPVIGIVGEIYIRSNRFGNENIIKEIESLGGEVVLPPISEWFHYINFTAKRKTLKEKNYRDYLWISLQELIQKWDERSLKDRFHGSMNDDQEPTIKQTLKAARPYLDSSIEGEAILSIGKTSNFIQKGASGIINVMPFACMPGTIVSALIKKYREENGSIPFLNMVFDGQEQTNARTRLEAFMYQAKKSL